MWDDGCVVEASQFSLHHPYVLQRIHTIGYKAYNLERHVALMRDASIALFGFASLCRVEDAARIIRRLLEASRVSLSLSCPVAMRLEVKEGVNNCVLINDNSNSDTASLDIALDFMERRCSAMPHLRQTPPRANGG